MCSAFYFPMVHTITLSDVMDREIERMYSVSVIRRVDGSIPDYGLLNSRNSDFVSCMDELNEGIRRFEESLGISDGKYIISSGVLRGEETHIQIIARLNVPGMRVLGSSTILLRDLFE